MDNDLQVIKHYIEVAAKRTSPLDADHLSELASACESLSQRLEKLEEFMQRKERMGGLLG